MNSQNPIPALVLLGLSVFSIIGVMTYEMNQKENEVRRLKSLIDQHSRDRLAEAGAWSRADVRLYLGANPEPATDIANPPSPPIREKR